LVPGRSFDGREEIEGEGDVHHEQLEILASAKRIRRGLGFELVNLLVTM
jgi:hypothetical protein